jgi:hypothetical protein
VSGEHGPSVERAWDPTLDEDIFDFGEVASVGAARHESDEDLEEILAAFESRTVGDESALATEPTVADALAAEGPRALAASAPRGQAPVARERAGMPRGVLLILGAVTLLNVLVALVTLKSTHDVRNSVVDAGRDVQETAREIRLGAYEQAAAFHGRAMPVAAPDPEQRTTFQRVQEDIEGGRLAQARQRLYATLAIVDRLEPAARESVEARASFLLAEVQHRQALMAPQEGP